jgi:hypothetical protein
VRQRVAIDKTITGQTQTKKISTSSKGDGKKIKEEHQSKSRRPKGQKAKTSSRFCLVG